MSAEDLSDLRLPGEREIITYCRDLASEVGVPLETVYFLRNLAPTGTPLHLHILNLHIKVRRSGNLERIVEFTQEEIAGYPLGQTTTAVMEKIRVALESVLPDLEEP
jgi:hypothetical protein